MYLFKKKVWLEWFPSHVGWPLIETYRNKDNLEIWTPLCYIVVGGLKEREM